MSYKLFIDDDPSRAVGHFVPEKHWSGEWVRAASFNEMVAVVSRRGMPELVSYDHDLSDEHYDPEVPQSDYREKTGLDCAKWMASAFRELGMIHPHPFLVHSMNPGGKANILSFLRWDAQHSPDAED